MTDQGSSFEKDLHDELLKKIRDHWLGLKDKPDETPETTLSDLWRAASKVREGEEFSDHTQSIFEERLRQFVEQRLAGIPLAYLTGMQKFMDIELLTTPGAMIPRKETEILGKAVNQKAALLGQNHMDFLSLDLCTGSGNVILAAAHSCSNLRGFGADITAEAVELARKNAAHLNLDDRVEFVVSDLFSAFPLPQFANRFHLITCNPPYISSAQVERMPEEIQKFEPREAFDGGPFGIKIINRLYREAPAYLAPGGWLCFEVGLGQGETLKKVIERSGQYALIEANTDEDGSIRVLALQKP